MSHRSRIGQGSAENRRGGPALLVSLVLTGAALLAPGCQEQKDKLQLPVPEAAAEAAALSAVDPPPQPPEHQAAAGSAPDAPLSVTRLTGTLEPHRKATIAPRVSASVLKVHVREGDAVKSGDPLVTLDPADIRLQMRQAQAVLEAATIQYEQAKTNWQRIAALARSQQASAAQLDAASTGMKAASAGRDQAQVALDMASKALRDSVVRAPFDGYVIRKLVSEGERVVTMPPTALVVIEETTVVDLRIQVPEMELSRIRPGLALQAHFGALGRTVPATITRIVPSVDARTRSFAVIAEIPNADHTLWPGMFSSVRLAGDSSRADSAPAIPAAPGEKG